MNRGKIVSMYARLTAWHVLWWCISLFACNEQFCIYVGSLLFRVCGTFLVFVILICLVFLIILRFLSKGSLCAL